MVVLVSAILCVWGAMAGKADPFTWSDPSHFLAYGLTVLSLPIALIGMGHARILPAAFWIGALAQFAAYIYADLHNLFRPAPEKFMYFPLCWIVLALLSFGGRELDRKAKKAAGA